MDFFGDILKKYGEIAFALLIRLAGCLLIFAVGVWLIGFIVKRFSNGRICKKLDKSLSRFLESFLRVALYILLFITAASVVGIPVTSFVTLLASAGVAIGLAMQGALSNLAGGIMILIFKPFRIGDYIEVGGNAGTVTDITVFYTFMCTIDNRTVTVPNGQITGNTVINYTARGMRRIDLLFNVAYESDIDRVVNVLEGVAADNKYVLNEPAPFAALNAHGESALQFVLQSWCPCSDYWNAYFSLQEEVKKAFDKNGITIPFPQLDVHSK